MVLSASRRTDIPCYYHEWFMKRLLAGYVKTKNPMNPSQTKILTLSPDIIDCIVFWTKDPLNMMDKLPLIDQLGYSYYFQFTLNPYGKDVECNLRDKNDIIQTFLQLSEYIGKDKILWRYDPIIINDEFNMDYHLSSFEALCEKLQSYTKICTISFVDTYKKLKKSVKEHLIKDITDDQVHHISRSLAQIACRYGIEIRACCEKLDLTNDGIKPAACIDKELLEKICGHSLSIKRDKNQRFGCCCAESVDIGVYHTCKNGCLYCYANHSEASINKNYEKHDSNSDILI